MKNNTLNKIAIFLQGRPLILHYQVRQSAPGLPAYIEVIPSADLLEFDLKGLTPDMFCVNIADMVNLRKTFAGTVENEKQIAVAHWAINHEEYLDAIQRPTITLTHQQIAARLAAIPGFAQALELAHTSGEQYVDFEVCLSRSGDGKTAVSCGYKLTIISELTDGMLQSRAYYYLDTCSESGWLDKIPPLNEHPALRQAIEQKLTEIRQAGIILQSVEDHTDYAQQTG